ncbi:MAG: hypothetical protein KY464_01655 [Gemmatimonadetes bacterium]|nr:hypothetical protein [Gemmatimonadota bacterium]
MKLLTRGIALSALVAVAGCGPHIQPLHRVMENGQVLRPGSEAAIERARVEGEIQREQLAEQLRTTSASALATCVAAVCDAITRGELVLGMTEAQVLAATRTTAQAWDVRGAGAALMMTARSDLDVPTDAVAKIAFVTLQNGRVASYTYREPQGYRTVTSPADAIPAGRSSGQAEALLRQGDDFVASGRLDLALERYDQADILRPEHPETTLRIARTLDKSLRPVEAVLRYRMFIHQMELERIRAHGEVAASVAEAIARAHERIIVLERR